MSLVEKFGRIALVEGATPIQRLHRLERALGQGSLGVRIFVKRDDLTGIGGGGNKLRKLEFLLAQAIAEGCDTFITVGGTQSNHARLSAAAAARAGLACELVLARVVPRDDEEYFRNGNVLLDGLFGATIHEIAGDADPLEFAEARAAELRKAGHSPFVVGSGGSTPVGCLGYAACAEEIVTQEAGLPGGFTRIMLANGSSGTHAGLAAGFAAMGMDPSRVQSFTVLKPADEAQQATYALAQATLSMLDLDRSISPESIHVSDEQRGEAYGLPTAAMIDAVRLLARTEGLLLDPVYSGKAFAGLLAAVSAGKHREGDALMFLMTGGTPGLFVYRRAFENRVQADAG